METLAALVTPDEMLCAALDIGENILKYGGEIRRVEDTIERIGHAFGAVHVEVFCVTSFLIASVRMPDGRHQQQMRRIHRVRDRLYMVEEMNSLSRALCAGQVSVADVHARICEARRRQPYPLWISLLAVFIFGVGATLFAGGSLRDGMCAALAGYPVFLLSRRAPKGVNPMILTVFSSFLAATLALGLVTVGLGEHIGFVMAGTVMHLVPGLAFGNSLRDMLGGDTLAGMMRLFHTVLVALMLALGFAAALFMFQVDTTLGGGSAAWYVLLPAGIAFTLGYTVQIELAPRRLLWITVGSLITTGMYVLTLPLGDFVGNLLTIFAVTVYCEIAARPAKAPVITFLTPSIIALVPGSLLYATIHSYIGGMYDQALTHGNRMLAAFFGMAAGILLGTIAAGYLFRFAAWVKKRRPAGQAK